MTDTYPGISFHGRSVNAIIEGRKTQTRRVLTPQPAEPAPLIKVYDWQRGENRRGMKLDGTNAHLILPARPRFHVGQWCYVREAWREGPFGMEWRADSNRPAGKLPKARRWKTGRYLPRAKARHFIGIVGVWVQRLRDIDDADSLAEGVERPDVADLIFTRPTAGGVAAASFAEHWDSINAARGFGWSDNPWVFVYEFVLNQGTRQ